MAYIAVLVVLLLTWLWWYVATDLEKKPAREEEAKKFRRQVDTAQRALVALGYRKTDACAAVADTIEGVRRMYSREPTLNEMIAGALRVLNDTS